MQVEYYEMVPKTLLQSKISTHGISLNFPVRRMALLFILRKQFQQVNKMYLKRKVSVAFCPLCLIISETESGAQYPAPRQASVSALFFKFVRPFRARINIKRFAVEKCADVEVDLYLLLPLPVTDFNQYWNIQTHFDNMSQYQIS